MQVTADDVEMAVEKAEKLWADALAAREKAEALAVEAEELATQSETSTATAKDALEDGAVAETFKLSMLGDAQAAMDVSIRAGEVLANAYDAAEEAERLEILAEEALAASEEAIEQHRIDFPDSELADEV